MTHSSANVQVVAQFESVMDSWISEVDKLLGDVDMPRRDANDVGPASELEYPRLATAVDMDASRRKMWSGVMG